MFSPSRNKWTAVLFSETSRDFSRTSMLRVSAAWSADRVHVCMYMCARISESSALAYTMQRVQFSCVIKNRVTASCIYYLRSHRPSYSRILVLFILSPLFLPLDLFSLFLHSIPRLISHEWSGRSANILIARHVRMRGNFIGPTRSACAIFTVAVARPLSQLFPVKCYKAKFPDHVVLAKEPRVSFSLFISPYFNNSSCVSDIDLRLTFTASCPVKFNDLTNFY